MSSDRLQLSDVHSTTAFRLSLLLGSLFLGGILTALLLSYVLTARELTARNDQILFARAKDLLTVPSAALPSRIRTEIANAAPGFSYFALEGGTGEWLVGNIDIANLPTPGHLFNLPGRPGIHGPVRVLTVRTSSGETLVLGRDITQIRDLRRRLLAILVGSGLVSVLATLTAAVALGIAPLRRVRDLQRASRAIADGRLDARMPIAGRRDELDQFAETVNLMVDEVVHVIAQVKTATDAIAHDLRTPLTRVRAALHRTRHDEAIMPAQAMVLDRAIADLDAVIGRFAALLRIAELEASGRRSGLAEIALTPLLLGIEELFAPLAEERGVTLRVECDPDISIHADPDLLFEAFSNLVDNALKFARSHVMVRAWREVQLPQLLVVDDGPGIPEDERVAVLRRFHRTAAAAGVEGTGLGLAVVSAILHLHGFSLLLEDAGPGLAARVAFTPTR